MLWNDLDDSSTLNNDFSLASNLDSKSLYHKVKGNTTHALHVPDISLFQSFVQNKNEIESSSAGLNNQSESRLENTNVNNFTQFGDNTDIRAKYMKYFQPSLDSKLYQDCQIDLQTPASPDSTGSLSKLSLDVDLPSELFSQEDDKNPQKVFRLFGEVVATKPLGTNMLTKSQYQCDAELKTCPSRNHQSKDARDDTFLANLSSDLKRALDNPFEFIQKDASVDLLVPADSNGFKKISNVTGLNQISPIKLVEYSSSENEETFLKPKAPVRRTKTQIANNSHSYFHNVTTVNQSKLQSTFAYDKNMTPFNVNSNNHAMTTSILDGSNQINDHLVYDHDVTRGDKSAEFINDRKHDNSEEQQNFKKDISKNEYHFLVDQQRLHLINLEKKLLQVKRLERIFAKISGRHEDRKSKGQTAQQRMQSDQREKAREQIELSVNREIIKAMMNSPNLSQLPASVLSPYCGKENQLQSDMCVDSLRHNSSLADIDVESKASYELSDACSQIKSILEESSDYAIDMSSLHLDTSAKLNETFVKSTFVTDSVANSPEKLRKLSKFDLKCDALQRDAYSKPIEHNLVQSTNDQLNTCKQISLQEIFKMRNPRLYNRLAQRSIQLAINIENNRRNQQSRIENELKNYEQNQSGRTYSFGSQGNSTLVLNKSRPKQNMKEIRQQTAKRYSQLPEVQKKRREQERLEETKRNRLMAKAYNAKLMQQVHHKQILKSQNQSKSQRY